MFQRIFCWNIRADIRISNNREIWDVDKTKHLCNLHSSVEVLYLTDRLQTTEVLVYTYTARLSLRGEHPANKTIVRYSLFLSASKFR